MPLYHIQTLLHVRGNKHRADCRLRLRNESTAECGYVTTMATEEQLLRRREEREQRLRSLLECADVNETQSERRVRIEPWTEDADSRIL